MPMPVIDHAAMRQVLLPPLTRASPIASLDQRWKLAAFAVAVVAVAALQSAAASFMALLATLTLVALARLPPRWYVARLSGPALILLAFTILLPFFLFDGGPVWTLGPVTLSIRGLSIAARVWCKALAIVTLVLVLIGSTPMQVTFQAAHALRVPGFLVQLAALMHRYIYLLITDLGALRVALRVRGYRNRPSMHSYRTIGHVAGILLVRGAERAERVSQAMRCRGFDGTFRSLATFRTDWFDLMAFTLTIGIACTLLWCDAMWR